MSSSNVEKAFRHEERARSLVSESCSSGDAAKENRDNFAIEWVEHNMPLREGYECVDHGVKWSSTT
ncbi:hypothetical protein DEO72_LG6g1113 [Vigna unguiculata]|uniref:Uncharacterized protein n=1 Tax=Vigna unguiculata TaxID=3917 RepID=A0A4D6M7L5_VIGUN|nr:hypothetical protein DEO72_LG6g1113 [Vigna unguiculata]